jgi:hypothetical protein
LQCSLKLEVILDENNNRPISETVDLITFLNAFEDQAWSEELASGCGLSDRTFR